MAIEQVLPDRGVWCVYLLLNKSIPEAHRYGQGNRVYYVGMTNHLSNRLQEHYSGRSLATKGGDWCLAAVITVLDRTQAATLEAWLKSGNSRQKREEMKGLFGSGSVSTVAFRQAFKDRAWLWSARRHFKRTIAAQQDRSQEQKGTI